MGRAALGPWVMGLVLPSKFTVNPARTFLVTALLELGCCILWVAVGWRRRTWNRRKRSAPVLYFLVPTLGLIVVAFYAWIVYLILYIAPEWG